MFSKKTFNGVLTSDLLSPSRTLPRSSKTHLGGGELIQSGHKCFGSCGQRCGFLLIGIYAEEVIDEIWVLRASGTVLFYPPSMNLCVSSERYKFSFPNQHKHRLYSLFYCASYSWDRYHQTIYIYRNSENNLLN